SVEPAPAARSPSDLGGSKALPGLGGQTEERALRFGSMVHRLLELGPSALKSRDSPRVIETEFGTDQIEDAGAIAQRIFDSDEFAPLFGTDALSEVPLTAELPGLGVLSGIIDKLIISEGEITAVDFKTNAVEPQTASEVPEGILRQMGAYQAMLERIYPAHIVNVAILWTTTARMMVLPHDIVRDAVQRASTS
ncbi:MAG: PD-(D/E)XK nuclease family protein, partial [Pseudomonadota bacterium]